MFPISILLLYIRNTVVVGYRNTVVVGIQLLLDNLGRCLLRQRYFYVVYDYEGKADLSKGYWNPERKLGITTHFFTDN